MTKVKTNLIIKKKELIAFTDNKSNEAEKLKLVLDR